MVLEERKCPNCGSNEILEKNGTFVCMNCRTFFDRPIGTTTTHIFIDETEIEKNKFNKYVFETEYEKATKKEREHQKTVDMLKALGILFMIALSLPILMIIMRILSNL